VTSRSWLGYRRRRCRTTSTSRVARFAASGFALLTPALIKWSPSGLFAMLTVFALVSGAIGAVIIRRTRGSRDEPAVSVAPVAEGVR